MAGEGMGLPPEVLQMLLPYILGSTSQQKSVFDAQGKGINNVESLLTFMLSPEFGVFTGTADPLAGQQMASQPAPYGPLTSRYMESGDVALSDIANGIVSGAYRTPEEAKAKLREYVADPASATTVTPDSVNSVVDTIFGEYVDSQAAIQKWQQEQASQQSVWEKAGLPDPTEQYYAGVDESGNWSTNMPLEGALGNEFSDRQRKLAIAQLDMAEFLRQNPDYRDPSQRKQSADDAAALEKSAAEAKDSPSSGAPSPSTYRDNLGYTHAGVDPNAVPEGMYRDPMTGELREIPKDAPNTHRDGLGNVVEGVAPSDPSGTYRDGLGNLRNGEDPNTPPEGWYRDPMSGGLFPIPTDSRMTYYDALGNPRQGGEGVAGGGPNDEAGWSARGLYEAQKNAQASDPEGDKMYREMMRLQRTMGGSQARAEAQALFMRNTGRSPLTDQLMAKLMMARQMGLTG